MQFLIEAMTGEWQVCGTIWSLLITIGVSAGFGAFCGHVYTLPNPERNESSKPTS